MTLFDAFVKSGGGHSNKDNDVDDGDNDHNHDGSDDSEDKIDDDLVFYATTKFLVRFIPGRERGW